MMMRQALVPLLALLSVAVPARASDISKDGFNFYKDYLRARSDDVGEGPIEDKLLYFYRTPLPLYPSLLPSIEQEYRKRTGNAFKNHMLSKEMFDGEVPRKRGSKTALSLLMGAKHPYFASQAPAGEIVEIPLKIE